MAGFRRSVKHYLPYFELLFRKNRGKDALDGNMQAVATGSMQRDPIVLLL